MLAYMRTPMRNLALILVCCTTGWAQTQTHPIVLRAARVLDVETGKMTAPGEILVQGDRIAEIGPTVSRPCRRRGG